MEFTHLVMIAILVEAIWENLKMVYKKKKLNINMIASLVLGIALCIAGNVDVFTMAGIPLKYPILAYIFTGVVCSRGANAVNDIFSKLKGE